VQVQGKGLDLATPGLPLTLPVVAQFLADDGTTECWRTTYTVATKNETAQFQAKGP
jgi:hypothetical protein